MKYLLLTLLLILAGCIKEVPFAKLVDRGGIYYEVNSQIPFTGAAVSYHINGQLQSKGDFKDGKRDGLFERYHANGQLKSKRSYKDGEKDGLREFYADDGKKYSLCYKTGKQVALSICKQ